METVIIRNQAEWDELPESYSTETTIDIHSATIIRISSCPKESKVRARDNSSVEAWDNSRVKAMDNSRVKAWDNSSVEAWDNSRVKAWDNSSVEAWDNSRVEAREYSSVEAWDNSRVKAMDNSSVKAMGKSLVKAWGNSSVSAWGNSSVKARGNSRVEAGDNSSVEAWGNSSVSAWGNSSVKARDYSSVKAIGKSLVGAWNNSSVVAVDNSHVEAWDNSRVEAWGNSSAVAMSNSNVVAWDNSSVEARGNSSVVAMGKSHVKAWDNTKISLYEESYCYVKYVGVTVLSLLDYATCQTNIQDFSVNEKSPTANLTIVPMDFEISFEEWLRRGYVVADGIHKKLISNKTIRDKSIYEVMDFPEETVSYVVRDGDIFSHGPTVKKAIEDLKYKLSDRDVSEFDYLKNDLNKEITLKEAIQAYRCITGACESGVKEFVQSIEVPKKLTMKVVLGLTKGHYGDKDLRNFLSK